MNRVGMYEGSSVNVKFKCDLKVYQKNVIFHIADFNARVFTARSVCKKSFKP